MRWALLALALAGWPPAASADPTPTSQGFDHVGHEGRVFASGGEPPTCSACHPLDARGHLAATPGHDDCFGACHGPAPLRPPRSRRPQPPDEARGGVCAACHAPADLAAGGRAPAMRAAPSTALDFALRLSHRVHADAADCSTCHRVPGLAPASLRRSHADCAGCHGGAARPAPAMEACEGCHERAFGPIRGPRLVRGRYPVSAGFDHRIHLGYEAPRSDPPAGGERSRCLPCHAAVSAADGNDVPAPSMQSCERCHDGQPAFATLAETCRRCHVATAEVVRALPPGGARGFAHAPAAHAALACHDCHVPSGDGAGARGGHGTCAAAACHADDFRSPAPTTCGACHVGVEPWRALHVDPLPRGGSAFGVRFSHAAHGGAGQACAGCHEVRGARAPVTGGHATCADDDCHGDTDSPRPSLADCASCHVAGLRASLTRAALARPWSVRARFRHDRHAGDPRTGEALVCGACHDVAEGAPQPPPTKARCAPCHDGTLAFDLAGRGCPRCHGRADAAP